MLASPRPGTVCSDRLRDSLLAFSRFDHGGRDLCLFRQIGLGWVGHSFRPNMEAASLRGMLPRNGDFPYSPNAFAFVVAVIEDIVLPHVTLGPVTSAICQGILPAHDEIADVVSAVARHLS